MDEQIFLSYRRSTASDKTRLLKLFLEKCGYTVFMDQDKIDRSKPFTEEIKRKIDECEDFIVVVTEGSLQYSQGQPDYLYEEILHAYKRNKESGDANVPRLSVVAESEIKTAEYGKAYATEVPPEYADALETVCKLTPLSALSFSGRDDEILSSIKTIMGGALKAQPSVKSIVEKAEDMVSDYFVGEKEIKRLTNQGEATYKRDRQLLQDILNTIKGQRKGRQSLTVLDVGCANGKTGKKYFAEQHTVSKVVGIDKAQHLICQALEEEQKCRLKPKRGPQFIYKQLDISADNFDEMINNLKKDNDIDNFDVIFCCQVLHHVANPRAIMEKLNRHLKDGGCFIIRASDDGSKMVYCPEYSEENRSLMTDIVDLTVSLPRMADRFHGRKLCRDLEHIGLSGVTVVPITTASSMVPAGERLAFLRAAYEESFSWRETIFQDKNRITPQEYLADEKKMAEMLNRLKKMFGNSNCWYCSTDYFGYGFKN